VPEAVDNGYMYGWRLLPQGDLVVSLKQPMHVLLGGAGISLLITLICYVGLSNLRERTTAAALVAQSEARWMYALQGTGDGVWDWDLRSDAMTFSAQWKAMLGYGDDDAPRSRSEWEQLVHPEDLPGIRHALLAHFDDEAIPYRSEQRMRTRDGAWIWILDRGAAMVRTSQGQPVRLLGTHTDITQRKLNETALHQSLEQIAADRQRMRSILENSYDAFLATDAEGHIIDWNQQAQRTFGWTIQEVMDKPLVDLIIPPAKQDAYGKVVERIRQGGEEARKGQRFEFTALHKSGREIPIELALAIMVTREGFTAHAFIRDITDRLEAARKEQQRVRSLGSTQCAFPFTETGSGRQTHRWRGA
jgi:PAS domain S-box-containing protein